MEPAHFYFFVLPLGVLIAILVAVVLYLGAKEESLYNKELKKLRVMLRSGTLDKKTFERMRNRLKEELTLAEEIENLHTLLKNQKIDQGSYVQLREQLEETYRQRIDSLIAHS